MTEFAIAPYGEVLRSLVASTMRAMAEFIQSDSAKGLTLRPTESVDDSAINRHFSWMALEYREGVNRHLFDGNGRSASLRTKGLRSRTTIPAPVLELLKHGESLDLALETSRFIRTRRTRISSLIRNAMTEFSSSQLDQTKENSQKRNAIAIPSPLAIVYDYLTIPDHPGSRAYPLLSIRNYLFETFRIIPDELAQGNAFLKLSVDDLEQALSHIRTSFRPRYFSRGQDKIPNTRSPVDAFLRHFLCLNKVFLFRFNSIETCREYLEKGVYGIAPGLEFERNPYLEKLPELAELVNEIWGLPLPIRGADTIFRGGLKFSARRGLVCALHGGPGSGKTSLSLGIGAALAGFGIKTVFFTAEESADDLYRRTSGLVSDDMRRLSFSPRSTDDWLKIVRFKLPFDSSVTLIDELKDRFREIASVLREEPVPSLSDVTSGVPSPCQTIVVLDGLHDLAIRAMAERKSSESSNYYELHSFIDVCRELQALVILTTGTDWSADTSLDYLVDVAIRLSHETESEDGNKPDRSITLSKARHQLCSPGTHGLQIAGQKGVRFTPQMNYQLDRKSIWTTRLPNQDQFKKVMRIATDRRMLHLFPSEPNENFSGAEVFQELDFGVRIFKGSNIFINGEGSGGKAALALKIAIAPTFRRLDDFDVLIPSTERVLIVSFLYPSDYYLNILRRLSRIASREYGMENQVASRIEVIHLYPGHLKPGVLFNRIEWELQSAELEGDPFTSVVIEGIHNVFLQFPEIERHGLFWPQMFSALRTRNITIISTHAMLTVASPSGEVDGRIDDKRSDPLRHALVQKTDFRFDVQPQKRNAGDANIKVPEETSFTVKTLSAIGQAVPPDDNKLLWSRERLVLFSNSQMSLPFGRERAVKLT